MMNFIYIMRIEFHHGNRWAGLVISVFPVVPLLFRNVRVAHAPHNSSNWRCQTGQSPQACLYVCPMLLLLTEGKMCHCPPSRLEGQSGWPPGTEEEFPGFISGFGKEILGNTNRIWRRLYMWDSNAVYGDLGRMGVNHERCSGCSVIVRMDLYQVCCCLDKY